MEGQKFRATCPICGHNLFRGAPLSQVDVNCPKCGQFLQFIVEHHGVTCTILSRRPEKPAPAAS